ncbi:hypothetical protein AB6D66_00580 [Vibrio pomeroyi]|uniref:Uncharacterized protein n=1 Tax=Vibrio pomeroyi TaxID=198832 RepID=A0ABV4MQX3_9VIBR|nr:hypothetical protein [Vibrio atlanticus]MCZ4311045.1 hypothetical protein [Vibrio atlanticus]
MKGSLKFAEIVAKYEREPDLIVDTDLEAVGDNRLDDDIALRYAIFFHKKALGGCIVYGQYQEADEWVVNPNLRYVVKHLSEQVLET